MDLSKVRERLLPYTRFGWRAGLLAAAKRALLPLAELGSVVVFELPVPRAAPVPGVREAGAGDVARLAATFARPEDELAARFARGDRAFIAVGDDGAPLHMRWATTQPTEIPECGLWLVPGPRQIYLYDAVTAPEVRGQRLTAAVRVHSDDRLAQDGYTGKLAYVRADNHAMWRAMRSAGPIKRLMRIGYVRPRGRDTGFALTPYGPPVFATRRGASG